MAYFTSDTFQFLRDLAANNSKEWMDEQRDRYQLHRQKMIDFSKAIYESFATVDTMPMVDPKKSVARINNNRRFQPDKPIYKTHFALMINRGEGRVGYYIHLEPDGCFIGGGIYHPRKEVLEAVRHHIDQEGGKLKWILDDSKLKKVYGGMQGEQLKTSPRDYEADHQHIDLLRYKDLTIMKNYNNKDFLEEDIVKRITADYAAGLPFLGFIDDAFQKAGIASE